MDQVRAINEIVAQHAQQNGNKLVYIQGAERLTEAAANALLKTLEEPRPNTYFLLQTEPSSSLLATIYSRCQVWNVPVPTESFFSISGRNIRIIDRTCDEFGTSAVSIRNTPTRIH